MADPQDLESAIDSARAAATPAVSVQPGPPLLTHAPEGGPEREFTVKARNQAQIVTRRFLRHKLAVGSLLVFLFLVALALVGGRVWHYHYADLTSDYSKPPSLKHPMGTDGIGHDTFAQVLHGAQKSVQVALLVALISTTFGTIVGALAGFFRGWLDQIISRITDLFLTIPLIAILAVMASTVSQKAGNWLFIALIISALSWMSICRVVRGVCLSLREKEFVEAARALGATNRRIIFRHLLPNAIGPIIVNATLTVAAAILIETALSYIGLGIKPPDTSLGLLVSDGAGAALTRPWLFYFPGLFIIIIALTINFVGDGLRDAFDPTQTRVRA
jgi:peptide/nickel transport system permease protein